MQHVNPPNSLRHMATCEQLLLAGDLFLATQELISLEAITPDSEQQWKRLHSLCVKLNDRTRAQIYTERFLGICNDNAVAHLACARNFLPNYDDRPRVRASVAAALENPRSDAGFWREVAEIQSVIADHEGVCNSARRSLALDPTDVDLREILISSLGALGREKRIRHECNLLAHFLAQSGAATPLRWARLARIAAEAGARKAASTYIDLAAASLSDANYGAHFELIRALILTKQPERAMKHLECLLVENSQNAWLWNTVLETAMRCMSYEIALIAIAQLRSLPCLGSEALYRLSATERVALRTQRGRLKPILQRWI